MAPGGVLYHKCCTQPDVIVTVSKILSTLPLHQNDRNVMVGNSGQKVATNLGRKITRLQTLYQLMNNVNRTIQGNVAMQL